MTGKDKAKQLVDMFREFAHAHHNEQTGQFDKVSETNNAKQCALIAVDELILIGWNLPHYNNIAGVAYWKQVKAEIELL